MNASRTARERARAELTSEIKEEARRQLAVAGADGMSLRAVARELGMVSSAVYRYFPSRDELLTALIIDAYQSLGDAAETAEAAVARTDLRGRWRATCRAARHWALAHPHEYALIYGSPIPGYKAPEDTVAQAIRVPLAIVEVLRESWAAGTLVVPDDDLRPILAEQTAALAELIAPELPGPVLARALVAWSQLYGMISFELFGQFVGSVDPAAEFFDHTVDLMATFTGLPADTSERPATA
ncbi:MAG TPA: TetR/AcrR family transcriptional regulator [Pseudonocardiaceae bacterium]|nr:TetR/AcrR family transcriptional regulator [Pseudonocardiaceae bacterium]